jgi:hypothetical protein
MQYLPVTLRQMPVAIRRFARSSLGDAATAHSAGFIRELCAAHAPNFTPCRLRGYIASRSRTSQYRLRGPFGPVGRCHVTAVEFVSVFMGR